VTYTIGVSGTESLMTTKCFHPTLSAAEQTAVLDYRDHHDDPTVRTKMNVLWAVHLGYTREQAAEIAHVGEATAKRYILAYRDGGLNALLTRKPGTIPISDLAQHAEIIKQSLTEQPVRTTAEAIERIHELTGIRRGLTQTRKFLADLGFTWQRTQAVPVPPKSR
jgi:transposase